jgi:hypothetical protein
MENKELSPIEDLKTNRLTQVSAGLRLAAWTAIPASGAGPLVGICIGLLYAIYATDRLQEEQGKWEERQSQAETLKTTAPKMGM